MLVSSPIRILEQNPNRKGDLFGKLMEGLFLALGYDHIRINIHKSGREIDLKGLHRTERRRVIAECKATQDPIGGDDINKFVGSLDAERKQQSDIPAVGYFVSLNGFTETAVEQEDEIGNERVTLLTGEKVVKELIKGRIVVSESKAMELAGRCAAAVGADLIPGDKCELLAHELGWLWLIYYTKNMEKTHFAFVHADGQLIGPEMSEKVINSDRSIGGDLHQLIYLAPAKDTGPSEESIKTARQTFEKYLIDQCGEIQLEGLPADEETGSRRLKLENIFVPLFVREVSRNLDAASEPDLSELKSEVQTSSKRPRAAKLPLQEKRRMAVGSALAKSSRIIILGPPGGGKSTLLKRLAVAYASPDRRQLIEDHLPRRPWLPLLVRCRQLDRLARRPFSEILDEISARAELPSELHTAFDLLVRRSLRNGEVLLLIDGLDEISEDGNRLSFVNQLRTFITMYPNTALVLTSREAGFRVIGGALSGHCAQYELAEFEDEDIKKLTVAWHILAVGDNSVVRKGAANLARTISRTPRVRQLARNPLLLTTLLLVQRWVGQLPTRRSVLYSKAIEVLLMTWNVEAHEPLDPEEALPQLEFLAMYMMKNGSQRISLRELQEVLANARKQVPEALAFARMGINDFIKRVELRSSLLMISGHEVERGVLTPVYEFRHLTFQEYLAARAAALGHYPDRTDSDDLAKLLHPHMSDPNWREVIPLAAVLAGRSCRALISDLIASSKSHPDENGESKFWPGVEDRPPSPWSLLATCLSDEVQIPPDLVREAMECVVERCGERELQQRLAESKYGAVYSEVARAAFVRGSNLLGLGGHFSTICEREWGFRPDRPVTPGVANQIQDCLKAEDSWSVAMGCLAVMHIAFLRLTTDSVLRGGRPRARSERLARLRSQDRKKFDQWLGQMRPLMHSNVETIAFSANWAFVWLIGTAKWGHHTTRAAIGDLVAVWRAAAEKEWNYIPAWALSSMPLIPRDMHPFTDISPDLIDFVVKKSSTTGLYESWAALMIAYYIGAPWGNVELAKLMSKADRFYSGEQRTQILKLLTSSAERPSP
jgi:hypothetical protein